MKGNMECVSKKDIDTFNGYVKDGTFYIAGGRR
jgi:hypothetical protein